MQAFMSKRTETPRLHDINSGLHLGPNNPRLEGWGPPLALTTNLHHESQYRNSRDHLQGRNHHFGDQVQTQKFFYYLIRCQRNIWEQIMAASKGDPDSSRHAFCCYLSLQEISGMNLVF